MTFAHAEPDHWTSRLGIIAMQFAAGRSWLSGAVCRYGDSLQEQMPALPEGYPFCNLPDTTLFKGPSCSHTFNCGLMGIGAADLATAVVALCGTTEPGRAIVSVGTNDAFAANNHPAFIAAWQLHVSTAVAALVEKTGAADNVLVETIPYALDGAHDNDLIDTFNTYLLSLSETRGVLTYDLVPRLFVGRRPWAGSLASDHVHLGPTGILRRAFDEQCVFTGQPLAAIPFEAAAHPSPR